MSTRTIPKVGIEFYNAYLFKPFFLRRSLPPKTSDHYKGFVDVPLSWGVSQVNGASPFCSLYGYWKISPLGRDFRLFVLQSGDVPLLHIIAQIFAKESVFCPLLKGEAVELNFYYLVSCLGGTRSAVVFRCGGIRFLPTGKQGGA